VVAAKEKRTASNGIVMIGEAMSEYYLLKLSTHRQGQNATLREDKWNREATNGTMASTQNKLARCGNKRR
jgi:hypothetical protein